MMDYDGVCSDLMLARRQGADLPSGGTRDDVALPGPIERLLAWALRWRDIRRDERLLMKQTDHMLRDIGIGRAEIERAVRGRGRHRPLYD